MPESFQKTEKMKEKKIEILSKDVGRRGGRMREMLNRLEPLQVNG
jgi:hypothetical protein